MLFRYLGAAGWIYGATKASSSNKLDEHFSGDGGEGRRGDCGQVTNSYSHGLALHWIIIDYELRGRDPSLNA